MKFKSSRQCERILLELKKYFYCSCGYKGRPYISKNSLINICPDCKKKYSPTNGTIFHNLRFGLLKAFNIVEKEIENNYSSKSAEVAKEFKITQKTAWHFLSKIRNNKLEIDKLNNLYEQLGSKTINLNNEKEATLKLEISYAKILLENLIDNKTIHSRLLKEGFSHDDIKYILDRLDKN